MPALATFALFALWFLFLKWLPRWQRPLEIGLGVVLLLVWPYHVILALVFSQASLDALIPGHLCDLAAIAGGFALLTKSRICQDLLVFWGIGATLHGLITPNLLPGEAPVMLVHFFLLHGGVVFAALHLLVFWRYRPEITTAWRIIAISFVYQLIIAIPNFWWGTNYAFQRAKPAAGSMFDAMGPWPWYLLVLQGVGILTFWLIGFLLRLLPAKEKPIGIPH